MSTTGAIPPAPFSVSQAYGTVSITKPSGLSATLRVNDSFGVNCVVETLSDDAKCSMRFTAAGTDEFLYTTVHLSRNSKCRSFMDSVGQGGFELLQGRLVVTEYREPVEDVPSEEPKLEVKKPRFRIRRIPVYLGGTATVFGVTIETAGVIRVIVDQGKVLVEVASGATLGPYAANFELDANGNLTSSPPTNEEKSWVVQNRNP